MRRATLLGFHLLAATAVTLLFATTVLAQNLPAGVTQAQMDAALADISELYGSLVVRADQAKAICNEEQYVLECARIGQKHGLFAKARAAQVSSLLEQFKGEVVEKMKACADTECLVEVAASVAKNLSVSDLELARTVDLTPQKVAEKRAIAEVAKTVGVDIEECKSMEPDEASLELLRACAKLAKHERMQRYIPEEDRGKVGKSESEIALKEALARGELACGDGTIEGCGTFCLNPSAESRAGGTITIPPICRDIAARYFGADGVRELERAHQNVQGDYDEAKERYMLPDNDTNRDTGETSPLARCSAIDYGECPRGEYRQESRDEFGCFVMGECIPFNTRTAPERPDRRMICPAMATVESCGDGEEKVVSYTSPDCGTYYACRPKPQIDVDDKFPYTFASGRIAVSFDEARMYCYESGSRGATNRGDKDECLRAFGITVPVTPEFKRCAEYGPDWKSVDESGNCFNEEMTEYLTPQGVLRMCTEQPVFGCANMSQRPPEGQKEQVWNDRGLMSWIRAGADPSRIASLKQACSGVSKESNVWLSGAGSMGSDDFGMPDGAKCRSASSCTSSQYFDGSSCRDSSRNDSGKTGCESAGGVWDSASYYCKMPGESSPGPWTSGPYATTTSASGSCSSEMRALLGTGCHSRSNAWFSADANNYVWPGTATVRSCVSAHIVGCSGTVTSSPSTASMQAGCASAGGTWDSSANYCRMPMDTYCPSGKYWNGSACIAQQTACGAGYTWNGTACVSSGTMNSTGTYDYANAKAGCALAGGTWDTSANYCKMPNMGSGTGSSSMNRCFYTNATRNSQPLGYSVWCERDYYNCHEGTSSGPSVSTTGLTLGPPSQCEGASSGSSGNVGSSGCASWEYWNGTMCVSSGGSGSGGGCGMYTSMSTCVAMSACKWENSACVYNTTSSGSSCSMGQYWNGSACVTTSSTDCPTGQYWNGSSCQSSSGSSGGADYSSMQSGCASAGGTWNSSSNYCVMPSSSGSSGSSGSPSMDYSSMQSGCASAGGTWDSASNYCRMPTSSAGERPLAFLCPDNHLWNGSFCIPTQGPATGSSLANALYAFFSLFAF